MHTRSLGRTDLRLSEIALGTWGLATGAYGPVTEERFDATLRAALDAGITTFDCAPVWGESEAHVGRALADAKIDGVVVTRAGARFVDSKLQRTFDVDALIADCEASLTRLGRDVIDLWMLHNPGDVTIRGGGWREAVERLEEAGKIRAWGMSVGDAADARVAVKSGAQAICVTHNLLVSSVLDDLVTELAENGVGVLARSPLMYGLLAGQWSEGRGFAEDDHRYRRWGKAVFEERLQQVDDLRFLVGADHPDLATAALRYVLTHSAVTCAITGARNPYQVGAAVDAASGPPYIGDEDMLRLAKVRGFAGL